MRLHPARHTAFTLLELLAVIAVIGILASLLFPSLTNARRAAHRARTKAQFAQWTAALESFRAEYGYYPAVDASNLVNGGVTATDHPFHDLLAGRRRDGSLPTPGGLAATQNPKLVRFHAFAAADFTADGLLRDGFDNTAIAILVDRDLDGVIRQGADFTTLPAVNGGAPAEEDFPASGVRAGVVFYVALSGATPDNFGFVLSWK